MNTKEILKKRILLLMADKSQEEFAIECGFSEGTLRNVLKKKNITLENIQKIADKYKKQMWWFFTEEPQSEEQKIAATISPGNERQKKRIVEQSKRPTISQSHLRLLVEWMDEYYCENEAQSLIFFKDIEKKYPSFKHFLEKKGFSEGNQATSPDNKSANSY